LTRAVDYLVSNKLVAVVRGLLVPTAIGDAVAHSAMPVDEAEQVFSELSLARSKLCLSGGDLHLLYLVTPPIAISEKEFEEFVQMNEDMFLGRIPEVRSILASCDTPSRRKRIILALILRDLVATDLSIGRLATNYGIQSGTIQYLQSNAATYCAMVSAFCDRLQWVSLAAALNSIKPRLHFGVPESLIELMEVEGISRNRARALAVGGFDSVDKIAHADPVNLAIALTRDLSVEGTQMSSESGAHRILNVACELIIENARIKLGLSPKRRHEVSTVSSEESIVELLSPISAPEFPDSVVHQLIGTQSEEHQSDFAFVSDDMLLAAETNLIETTPIQESPERLAYPLMSPLEDDRLLLEAFESIEARVSTVPPPTSRRRRRISEMTTIDVGLHKRRSFDIPLNETAFTNSENIHFPVWSSEFLAGGS
jgi:DNA polymerase theta